MNDPVFPFVSQEDAHSLSALSATKTNMMKRRCPTRRRNQSGRRCVWPVSTAGSERRCANLACEGMVVCNAHVLAANQAAAAREFDALGRTAVDGAVFPFVSEAAHREASRIAGGVPVLRRQAERERYGTCPTGTRAARRTCKWHTLRGRPCKNKACELMQVCNVHKRAALSAAAARKWDDAPEDIDAGSFAHAMERPEQQPIVSRSSEPRWVAWMRDFPSSHTVANGNHRDRFENNRAAVELHDVFGVKFAHEVNHQQHNTGRCGERIWRFSPEFLEPEQDFPLDTRESFEMLMPITTLEMIVRGLEQQRRNTQTPSPIFLHALRPGGNDMDMDVGIVSLLYPQQDMQARDPPDVVMGYPAGMIAVLIPFDPTKRNHQICTAKTRDGHVYPTGINLLQPDGSYDELRAGFGRLPTYPYMSPTGSRALAAVFDEVVFVTAFMFDFCKVGLFDELLQAARRGIIAADLDDFDIPWDRYIWQPARRR